MDVLQILLHEKADVHHAILRRKPVYTFAKKQ